jgi:hypothetical protein
MGVVSEFCRLSRQILPSLASHYNHYGTNHNICFPKIVGKRNIQTHFPDNIFLPLFVPFFCKFLRYFIFSLPAQIHVLPTGIQYFNFFLNFTSFVTTRIHDK